MKCMVKPLRNILVLLLCLSFLGGVIAQDDMFNPEIEIEDLTVGDFLEWNMEMDEDGMEMSGNFRGEITDIDGEITVKGEQYSVVTFSMYGEGTLNSQYGIDGTWTMSGSMYIDKESEKTVKTEMTMEMTMDYLGETMESVIEEIAILLEDTSTLPEGTRPSIGDNWTTAKTEEITETQTIIYPDGTEDTSSDTYVETTTKYYEYLRDETVTVPAGTFTTSVIYQVEDDDDEGDYTLQFLDKEIGFEVMYEYYDSSDDLTGEVELNAYNFKDLHESGGESVLDPIGSDGTEEDTGMFNLGKIAGIDTFLLLILFVIIIVIIAGIMAARRRGEPKAKQDAQQPQQPQAAQPQYVQQAQRQPSAQPLYAQQAPSSNPCPYCLQPLTYIQQYQRWYCHSCQRYP